MTDVYSGSNKIIRFKFVVSKPGMEDMEFNSFNSLVRECSDWDKIHTKLASYVQEALEDQGGPIPDDDQLDDLWMTIGQTEIRGLLEWQGYSIMEVLV